MTPKEALNNLIHHIYSEGSMDVNERENYRHIIQESFDELEALKKPPTVDEVCMELSRHYKEQVSYSNERHNHMFYFEKYKMGIVRLRDDSNVGFIQGDYHKTNNLPPYLVTLIGRFYEGLEE